MNLTLLPNGYITHCRLRLNSIHITAVEGMSFVGLNANYTKLIAASLYCKLECVLMHNYLFEFSVRMKYSAVSALNDS